MSYDSKADTLEHIAKVNCNMMKMVADLIDRGQTHDQSKLEPFEKEAFDRMTPMLAGLTYGSQEYKDALVELGPALQHHYKHNTHHPEFHDDGIDGMSLMDIVEMLCDWKAATERHNDGDLARSIEINSVRFGISNQLKAILFKEAQSRGWID